MRRGTPSDPFALGTRAADTSNGHTLRMSLTKSAACFRPLHGTEGSTPWQKTRNRDPDTARRQKRR
jgi:hypothetical protein